MTQTEHRNNAPNAKHAPQPAESGAPENLNRAGRYDLHIHSAISDGTQSLTELVPLIARAGLAGFALTDHDTTAGWVQAGQLAGGGGPEARQRVQVLTDAALRRGYVDTVTVSRVPSGDLRIVEVTVTAPFPVLGLFGPGGTLRVTGHAIDESSLIQER